MRVTGRPMPSKAQCEKRYWHLQGLGMVGCDFFPNVTRRRTDLVGLRQCLEFVVTKIGSSARG